jgi:hypothetical protein
MQEPLHHEHRHGRLVPPAGKTRLLLPVETNLILPAAAGTKRPRRAEGAGVEPARGFRPQPVSNRCPAPIGRPFRCLFNASTRTRTQNIPLEAGHDLHFTIEALQKRKARDSNPHLPLGRAALAVRSGQPYPATFRIHHSSSGPTGSRTRPVLFPSKDRPPCHSGVVPLDQQPIF